ncbi:MAG: MCE family protein [Nitrospirae bacterium]|nr:MCE family protein [Nitrospirota bacterium]
MKKSKDIAWSQMKVGIFVIASLAIFMIFVFQVGRGITIFSKKSQLSLYLDSASGLKVGDVVRVSGIDVGNVKSIRFPESASKKGVEVEMVIDREAMQRIRADSVAIIGTIGLLGDRYIEITAGDVSQPEIKDKEVIKGVGESDIDRTLSMASASLNALNRTLKQLEEVLDMITSGEGSVGRLFSDPKLYDEASMLLKKSKNLIENVEKGRGTMGKFVVDDTVYNNLLSTSKKADQVFERLNTGNLAKLSDDKEIYNDLKSFFQKSNIFIQKLDQGSEKADSIIEGLRRGEGSAGKLLKDDKLYEEAMTFFKNADELVKDIKENPRRYFKFSLF